MFTLGRVVRASVNSLKNFPSFNDYKGINSYIKGLSLDTINKLGSDGKAEIHGVVSSAPHLIEPLKEIGANLNLHSAGGNTPMKYALSGMCPHESVKALLECGAGANLPDRDGYSPMHNAVLHGKILPMIELHKGGAYIDSKIGSNASKTPLYLSVKGGINPSMKYFIAMGAKINPEILDLKKSEEASKLLSRAVELDGLKSPEQLIEAAETYAGEELSLYARAWWLLFGNHIDLTEDQLPYYLEQIQAIPGVRLPLAISGSEISGLLGGVVAHQNGEFDHICPAGA